MNRNVMGVRVVPVRQFLISVSKFVLEVRISVVPSAAHHKTNTGLMGSNLLNK